MTEEHPTTPRQGLADGFTPLRPPTHLRIDFALTGTPVAGHVVIEVDHRLELDDLWKTDPAFNYAAPDAYDSLDRFIQPFEYDRDEPGFITEEMAEAFFDAVKSAADAAYVAFEWDYLDAVDVWVMAWLADGHAVQLDHQYGDEHALRLDDARFEVTWLWGGADV